MSKVTGSDNLTASVKLINKQLAQEILANSKKHNRRRSQAHIKGLAFRMDNGEWVIAQPLMFDVDGNIIDGQHRLYAVIKSGVGCYFLIIRGFDWDTVFGHMDDSTRVRTLSDHLEMLKEENPDTKAKVVRMAMRYEKGLIPTGGGSSFIMTPILGIAFLANHPKIRVSVDTAPATVSTLAPRALCAWLHYEFAKKDRTIADSFFLELMLSDSMSEYDPIYLLRERMKSNKHAKAKLEQVEVAALFIKAWNAVRKETKTRQLKWVRRGPGAESFPDIA